MYRSSADAVLLEAYPIGWTLTVVSPSGSVVAKCCARTAPNPSFDASVMRIKGAPSNLGARRTGSSSRMRFSRVNALVCLAVQYCVRLWSRRNWRCFHFPLRSCDMSRLRCRSVSGAAIRE